MNRSRAWLPCLAVALGAMLWGIAAHCVAQEEHPPSTKGAAAGHAAEPAVTEHAGTTEPGAAGEHGAAAEHAAAGEHDAGHFHDPTDLTHGNASPQLKAAQELRFDLAIATFVIFLLLLGILTKFAWGPISHGLEQREETIARQIEEARVAAEHAVQQLKEYESRLAAATDEARTIVSHARKDAEAAKDRIVAEARDAAQKEREKAVADITSAKNLALREIAEKSVHTAISLASNIIRREVRPEDHDQLIDDSLQQFSKLN